MSDIGNKITALLPSVEQIAEVALNVAKVLPVSGSIVSGITLAVQIANGVANEIPAILQAYDDIKAAVTGGQPITEEQWSAWQEEVDHAHADFVAAAQKVEAQP